MLTNYTPRRVSVDFGELKDSLIKNNGVAGVVSEHLREKLLKTRDLTLATTTDICRVFEKSQKQINTMKNNNNQSIEAIETRNMFKKNPKYQKSCSRCGTCHQFGKYPAWGKTCGSCNKPNNFSKVCKFKKKVRAVQEKTEIEAHNDEDYLNLNFDLIAVEGIKTIKEW